MWWAIVTITTVGYGDVTPVTLAGRMIASVTMVTGYVMLGLPVGIVATAFAEEIHRREFVVTWGMVASVPLFRTLDAIGDRRNHALSQRAIRAGGHIDRASRRHCAIDVFHCRGRGRDRDRRRARPAWRRTVLRRDGDPASRRRAAANVRASEPTKLLILDAYDLQTLIARNPEIGEAIRKSPRAVRNLLPEEQHGDIIEAELEEPAPRPDGASARYAPDGGAHLLSCASFSAAA